MPTFIKPGFWNKKRKQLAGELDLDFLIQQSSSSNPKVYVALVTQIGTYPILLVGPLVVGQTYITFPSFGDDFSNVGYITAGVPFIATGTTPTTWTNGSQVQHIISSVFPTLEVIENTLGITLTPSVKNSNSFFLNSDLPVFLQNKTFLSPQGFISNNGLFTQGLGLTRINDSQLISPNVTIGNTQPFTIKIEVYN